MSQCPLGGGRVARVRPLLARALRRQLCLSLSISDLASCCSHLGG